LSLLSFSYVGLSLLTNGDRFLDRLADGKGGELVGFLTSEKLAVFFCEACHASKSLARPTAAIKELGCAVYTYAQMLSCNPLIKSSTLLGYRQLSCPAQEPLVLALILPHGSYLPQFG
jgi:hypothetical protein